MAASAEAQALSEANRTAQARRAAVTAALVAYYYRTRVNVEEPSTIEAWLALVIPKILADRDASARQGATFATQLRKLELPQAKPFTFEPSLGLDPVVLRSSLASVGVGELQTKMREIRALDDAKYDPTTKQALIVQAEKTAEKAITGATMRHVQNGGRDTIIRGSAKDRTALGYVRVTKPDPCYFCAMLASRGLVFAKDSFDESDPRFVNGKEPGTAKVHDHCSCGMEPVYVRKGNVALEQADAFFEMWKAAGTAPKGVSQITQFRRLYEGRAA